MVIRMTRFRVNFAGLSLAVALLLSNDGLAAPIPYFISADVSRVTGTPFGTTINVGDRLTGTVIFDPESVTPFSALSLAIGTNTYAVSFEPNTENQLINRSRYSLGYNIGSLNLGGNPQWVINGVRTLVDYGAGTSGVYGILYFEVDTDKHPPNYAPATPTLRGLDSLLWDKVGLQLDNGLSGANFTNVSISAAAVPEPTSVAFCALGAIGIAYRAQRKRKLRANRQV